MLCEVGFPKPTPHDWEGEVIHQSERMAVYLGLAEPRERLGLGEILSRFDPELLPREPTVWGPGW